MRRTERGFLLLTSPLGDSLRKPLTLTQFRNLAAKAREMDIPMEDRDLTHEDLSKLGYDRDFAYRILHLLSQEDLLDHYLRRCKKAGCDVISRIGEDYPGVLRQKLDPDSPATLWVKGDLSLLRKPAIALVGSRDIDPENRTFAWEVGAQAARQGYVLISGNARGADRIAQAACLRTGGQVIIVVADELEKHTQLENCLYISEDGFDLSFSAQRALSRNRLIHALAEKTFVAQCACGSGGTWDGTVKNLTRGLSPVFCYQDGSDGTDQLVQMGAQPVTMALLADISQLKSVEISLFDL